MRLNIDWAGRRPDARQRGQRILLLTVATCMGMLPACKPVETRFEIAAFHEGAPARNLSERFDDGRFSRNAHRDLTMVFEVHDADSVENVETGDGTPVPPTTQIVTVQVFWEARPGTTHVESSQTNATISYCLISGPDSIRYSGAGFVFLTKNQPDRIEGRIESSSLKVAQVVGKPRDLFGRCRIQGEFAATEDKQVVVAKTLRVRRLFGAPGHHQTPQPNVDLPIDD